MIVRLGRILVLNNLDDRVFDLRLRGLGFEFWFGVLLFFLII